jgi:hypothetical protein
MVVQKVLISLPETEEEEYETDTTQDEKLLMDLEKQRSDQVKIDIEECEVVVNMEGELISALEEISRLKKNNRLRKEQLQIYKEKDNEIREDIVILKIQLEEAKRKEEILMNQIKEKENICDKLEEEIVSLRKYLEKSKTQMNIKFVRGSEILDNILNNQRSRESSINMSTTEKPTSYANALKGNNNQPNKSENEKKKQSELDHPNHANKYEARKQQTPESYQVGRQRPIPSSKFFIPRNPNFFLWILFLLW